MENENFRLGNDFVIPANDADGKLMAFELGKLNPGRISNEAYRTARESVVRTCHDVYIETELDGRRGLLLVVRDAEPAKGALWPIGGAMRRGIETEESLRYLTRRECGLELDKIVELGGSRVFCARNPFAGSELGSDEYGVNFYAIGQGKIDLDNLHKEPLHKEPRIVTSNEFFSGLQKELHPYVQKYMKRAFDVMLKHFS